MDMQLCKIELFSKGVDLSVIERMDEIVNRLDDAYNSKRTSRDMGGYIFFFDNEDWYKEVLPNVLEYYNLCKENCEYSEVINPSDSQIEWWEELYLMSSDDSIVFIHPRNKSK